MMLSLVEGLTDAELAQVMGLDEVDAAALVSAARGRVDRVLGSLLIARLGSEACPEMTELRKDWDRSFSDGFRTRVSQHVGGCEICKARRGVLLEPATVLAKIMALDSPPDLRQRVLDRVFPPRLEPEATMAAPVAAAVITPPAMPVVTPAPVPTEPPPVAPALDDPVPLSDTAKFAILGAVALVLGLIGVAVSAGFGPLDRPEVTTIPVSPGSGSTTTTFTDPASTTTGPEASASTTTPDTPVALGVSVETHRFRGRRHHRRVRHRQLGWPSGGIRGGGEHRRAGPHRGRWGTGRRRDRHISGGAGSCGRHRGRDRRVHHREVARG